MCITIPAGLGPDLTLIGFLCEWRDCIKYYLLKILVGDMSQVRHTSTTISHLTPLQDSHYIWISFSYIPAGLGPDMTLLDFLCEWECWRPTLLVWETCLGHESDQTHIHNPLTPLHYKTHGHYIWISSRYPFRFGARSDPDCSVILKYLISCCRVLTQARASVENKRRKFERYLSFQNQIFNSGLYSYLTSCSPLRSDTWWTSTM